MLHHIAVIEQFIGRRGHFLRKDDGLRIDRFLIILGIAAVNSMTELMRNGADVRRISQIVELHKRQEFFSLGE